MTGTQEIEAERRRQINVEGWNALHDDQHDEEELARAAECYERNAGEMNPEPPKEWTWDLDWWKPRGERRDLVRAGALYLAEAERHERELRAFRNRGGRQSPLRWKREREIQERATRNRKHAERCAKAIDAMDALAAASA